jgi:hypothetical protein
MLGLAVRGGAVRSARWAHNPEVAWFKSCPRYASGNRNRKQVMIFTTVTNSLYEVDEAGHRIRRLAGERSPTPRQGHDGEWKEYALIGEIAVGRPVLIGWRKRGADGGLVMEGTLTSPVSGRDAGLPCCPCQD